MLENKVCIVTGALGGLGQTAVKTFLHNGATVVGVDSEKVLTDEFRKSVFWQTVEKHNKWKFRATDVLSESHVNELTKETILKYSKIDILINLVGGIYPWSEVTEVETKTWDFTIDLNLKSTFLCSREVLKIMKTQKNGKIINVGAIAGLKGGSKAGPYGVAKAGVINLTETMAEENKIHNIQINAIVPSIIDTPANRKSMPDADFSNWVKAEEIAELLLFLASDKSSGVTGSIIKVPGRV
ncbi:SDR family oxidoreductase [bacterium]|nr:MAG: SDR family oxidoreductase [bacterium]